MRGVLTRHVCRTGRGTGGSRCVGLHESFAQAGKVVHVRRLVNGILAVQVAVIARGIHPTEIIGEDMNDIGLRRR